MNIVVQRQHFRLHVVSSGIRRDGDGALVLHLYFGVDLMQLHHIGLGDVLVGGLGGEFIGSLIDGETAQTRLLHRDLGSFDHKLAEISR